MSDGASSDWQAVLHGNHQVVLYNPTNKALTVTGAQDGDFGQLEWEEYEPEDVDVEDICPYCHRPMPSAHESPMPAYPRAPNYFHLLAESTSSSRPPPEHESSSRMFAPETLAEGYFDTFFREERKLGMGANGSVFLCQHVLDGNMLGHFAVKKIAVGSSHDYLVKILREVRLLETLRHQNIVTYHHSWLETCRFSTFGPAVPTLFVLMQWAEGGSLDDFIASRQGLSASGDALPSNNVEEGEGGQENMTKAQRIAAFRARNRQESHKRSATMKAIHLLSADEILSLFADVTAGLAFLHDRAILHLDLKPGNVLLTWDAGSLVPRAMLSDFGASKDMLQQNTNTRTGVTGTLEYTAPEVLRPDPTTGMFREMDTKSDIWSLGIILHKLIFFATPFQSDDFTEMQDEILSYMGFFLNPDVLDVCIRRGLPAGILHLLTTLLDIDPFERPTSERVLNYVRSESTNFARPKSPPNNRATRRTQPMTSSASNSLVRSPYEHFSPSQQQQQQRASRHSRASQQSADGEIGVLPSASSSQSTIIHDPPEIDTSSGRLDDNNVEVSSAYSPSSPRNSTLPTPISTATSEPSSGIPPSFGRPDLKLPIPKSTSRTLPTALWAIAAPDSFLSAGAVRVLKSILLMAKIVTLARYSGATGEPDSLTRSTIIGLAAALAVVDIWDIQPSVSSSSSLSFSPASATPAPLLGSRSSPVRSAGISIFLALVHIILLAFL